MALTYRQVKDLYDTLADAGATTLTLPEWSAQMNANTESDLFGEGLSDNWIKRASVGIDRALEWTGLPDLTEKFGRGFGELLGAGDTGASIGRQMPRMLFDFAPLLIPGAGQGAALARLAGTGLLSGAGTYTQTGSPAAGLLAGATSAAMPKIANVAEQSFLKRFGGELVEGPVRTGRGLNDIAAFSEFLPRTAGQGFAANAVGELAASAAEEVSGFGQDLLADQPLHNPFSVDTLLGLTLEQVPFAAVHGVQRAMGTVPGTSARVKELKENIEKTRAELELRSEIEAAANRSESTDIPVVQRSEGTAKTNAEIQAELDKLNNRLSELASEPTETVAAELVKTNDALNESLNEAAQSATEPTIRGERVDTASRTDIVGTEHFVRNNEDGSARYRIVRVTEGGFKDSAGNEVKPGDLVGYSVGQGNPTRQDEQGRNIYGIPVRFATKVRDVWAEERASAEAHAKANDPQLDLSQWKGPTETTVAMRILNDAMAELGKQQSPQQLRNAFYGVNTARELAGMRPFDADDLLRLEQKHAKRWNDVKEASNRAVNQLANKTRRDLRNAKRSEQRIAERAREDAAAQDFVAGLYNERSRGADANPETLRLADALEKLQSTIATRGNNGSLMVTTGQFEREALQWKQTRGLETEEDVELLKAHLFSQLQANRVEKPLVPATPKTAELEALPEDDAMSEVVREKAAITIGETTDARAAFESWPGKAGYTLRNEASLFMALVEQRALHAKGGEAAVQVFMEHEGMDAPEARSEAEDYFKRPHVRLWMEGLEQRLTEMRNMLPAIRRVFPAGDNWLFSLGSWDAETRRLNDKHVLPKDGKILVSAFKNMAGANNMSLPNEEIALFRELAPEAFVTENEKSFVNVPLLMEKLEGVKVAEVKEFGPEGKVSEARAKWNDIRHNWYDTLPQDVAMDVSAYSNLWKNQRDVGERRESLLARGVDEKKLDEFIRLDRQVTAEPPDTTPRAQWMSISSAEHGVGNPHGYFEMAVAVPHDVDKLTPEESLRAQDEDFMDSGEVEWANKKTGILFSGQHAPFPPNTLIHLRGYFAEHLTEGRVLVLDEVQSDWGQRRREALTGAVPTKLPDGSWGLVNKRGERTGRSEVGGDEKPTFATEQEARAYITEAANEAISDHPLLPVAHVLGLKAVLAKIAKESPGTKVMIVGPETAMMTERHDVIIKRAHDAVEKENKILGADQFKDKVHDTVMEQAVEQLDKDYGRHGARFEIQNGKIVMAQEPFSGGMTTAYGDEYFIIRDAEGKTLKGKVFRTEADANAAAGEGQTVAPQTGTLVSALRTLTGDAGREVVMPGVHAKAKVKNDGEVPDQNWPQAQELYRQYQQGLLTQEEFNSRREALAVVGSPVFRDPSGNPETRITGTVFNTDKAVAKFNEQEGFSLTRAAGARQNYPPHLPSNPYEQKIINAVGNTGETLHRYLMAEGEPDTHALMRDVEWARNLFSRFTVVFADMDESSRYSPRAGGRGVIYLNSGLLASDPLTMKRELLHEFAHGLTYEILELPESSRARAKLKDMRNQLMAALPEPLKSRVRKAMADGLYSKHSNGKTVDWSVLGNAAEQDIGYALMDDHELIAQMWSNKSFVDFAKKVSYKGEREKLSVFAQFKRWVKELFRARKDVDHSIVDELLATQSNLLVRGEYVATFRNFVENAFMLEGEPAPLAQAYTQRALGLMLRGRQGFSKGDALSVLNNPGGVSHEALRVTEASFNKMWRSKRGDHDSVVSWLQEQGYEGSQRGFEEWITETLHDDSSGGLVLDALPPTAARYLHERLSDAERVLFATNTAINGISSKYVAIAEAPRVNQGVRDALKSVTRMMKATEKHQASSQLIRTLSRLNPSLFVADVLEDNISAPSLRTFVSDKVEDAAGWRQSVSRFFRLPMSLAREFDEAKELITNGFQILRNSRLSADEAMKAYGQDNILETMKEAARLGVDVNTLFVGSNPTPESVKRNERMFHDKKILNGVNQWVLLNQQRNPDAVTILPDTDDAVRRIKSKFSPEEWTLVVEGVNKHSLATQRKHQMELDVRRNEAAIKGGTILLKSGMRSQQAIKVAGQLQKALELDFRDPRQAAEGNAIIESVRNGIAEPNDFLLLFKAMKNEATIIKELQEHYRKNPAWSTGRRYGEFTFTWWKNGEGPFRDGADSKDEARLLVKEHGGTIDWNSWKRQNDAADTVPGFGFESQAMFNRLRELTKQTELWMMEAGADPALIEIAMGPARQLETEATYSGGVSGLQPAPRGLTRGADKVNWMGNHLSWIYSHSNYWARRLFRAQAAHHLMNPQVVANKELHEMLKQHVMNVLQPDPPVASAWNRLVRTWFMGYNPATVIVNATQPLFTGVAELTNLTGRPIESYGRIMRAMTTVANRFAGKKGWPSKEHEWFHEKLVEDGEVSLSAYDENAAAQELLQNNWKRVMKRQRGTTIGQMLGDATSAFHTYGMWMFRHGEQFNNRVAAHAAFDLFREQGLTREAAYEKAVLFNRQVNMGGGKANRPIGMFSGTGPFPRGLAMVSTVMQGYTMGVMSNILHYLKTGYMSIPGTTPAQRSNARKAFVQLMVTQFAASGAMGMPFAAGVLALIEKAFPGSTQNIRELVSQFFGEDEEQGGRLTDAAMTGLPSMLGWDLQSRLSLGNAVPGVSEYNGFQPELLLGPSANFVGGFASGAGKLLEGDVAGARSFVPPAVRKLTELIMEDGKMLDYRGRPIGTPTPGEQLGIALGFNPKRLSDFNAASRMAQTADTLVRQENQEFIEDMTAQAMKGNFGTVRGYLISRAQQDETFDWKQAARDIALTAEAQTFPRDLRNEGTRASAKAREKLLSTFRLDNQAPNESARLQYRAEILKRLGVPADLSQEAQVAQLVDQLRAENPTATRAELRRAAERALRRTSPSQEALQ